MIYAIDFDNTLAYGEYPKCGTPNIRLIDWLKRRKKEGHRLILWTCRQDKPLEDAVKWCEEQGLVFDAINENLPEMVEKYGNPRKIFCDYYIDDNHFTSDFLIKKTEHKEQKKRRTVIIR